MKAILHKWDLNEEQAIWQNSIFVFDSSTLLNFYELSEKARQDIYVNIFPHLKDRLWITNQSEYEFLKHREKVIKRPDELYLEIKDQYYPTKHIKSFIQQYEQLKIRTSKDSRHPYLTPESFKNFDDALNELHTQMQLLENSLNEQIDKRLGDHANEIKHDSLLSFFKITPGYTFRQLIEIIKEGEFRFRHKIPPGYEDEKTKEKFGIAKFGDLIIWKQTMGLAQQIQKPVLLILDDLKTDWCITDKSDKRKMVEPRGELIKEMKDECGVSFWSYSMSQFIYKAKEIFKSKIGNEVIEGLKELSANRGTRVEEAVFAWAKQRFRADETVRASDFWANDTGADIIQTLDGVPFSIQIKFVPTRIRMKELFQDIEEIRSIKQDNFKFELNTVVLVTESAPTAEAIQDFMMDKLPDFELFVGYINEKDEFVEIKK